MRKNWKAVLYAAALAAGYLTAAGASVGQTATNAPTARAIGTIQSVSGSNLTLKTDQGVTTSIAVQDGARVLRIEPGETSLAHAAPIPLSEIQVGDRVLASGQPGAASNTLLASSVIAIKKADLASKQQQDLQEWTRRGMGGLVAAVDTTAGTISLKVASGTGDKTVTVHTDKATSVLRYAADSVKFSDAKPSTLEVVKAGDQLLARGTRSADGNDFTAEAVISGAFHNLSGTIFSINSAEGEITLTDLATKKPYTVKITTDSQMHKLATQAAAMLAARMKGTAAGGATAAGAADAAATQGRGGFGGGFGRGAGRGFGAGGGGDLSQVIARSPVITIADLQKGDAVMIVSTTGTDAGPVSAITLVAGVEPILVASPTASMNLPAWNVGGGADAGATE